MDIETSIDIDAPAETVWNVLTDFEVYPEWNDYTRIDGIPMVGNRLRVAPGPKAGRLPTFKPRLLRADHASELTWLGHLYVRGLFDGEHSFVIERVDEEHSRLVQRERFGGVLARPLMRLYGERTQQTFEAVNEALKLRSESLAAA